MASQPSKPSAAYRYMFVVLLGMLVGVVATVMLMRSLQARRDPFPDSLMHVMAKQAELLGRAQSQNRCTTADTLPRLQTLRSLSNDIDVAFPDLKDDQRFGQHSAKLRATLDGALAAAPTDCSTLATLNTQIGEDCKACHRDFR